ncbi:hypothetical protein [Cedecea sp.]|uniref:hypothetical protein n=1 Tax=Cedecea sp. TaxID=1970739 RepID=UPI002F3F6EDF
MSDSREQFEAWYRLNWGHTEDRHESIFEISECHGCYCRLGVRMAYDAWQASRAAGKIVAYMTHHGSAVSPDDFAGAEEEMHHSAKMEGWTPLIAGITVKGEEDEANANDS